MESNSKRIDLNHIVNQGQMHNIHFFNYYIKVELFQLILLDFVNHNYVKWIYIIRNNHNELMSNFFAQCDALALAKTRKQVKKELEESKLKKKMKIKILLYHMKY